MKKDFSETIIKEITGLFLVGFSIFSAFVLINGGKRELVGYIGEQTREILLLLIGGMEWLFPLLVFLYGFILLINRKVRVNGIKLTSFLLFFVFVSALRVILNVNEMTSGNSIEKEILTVGCNKEDGGIIGAVLSLGLFKLFGKNGTIIMLSTLIFICVLIFANTFIRVLIAKMALNMELNKAARKAKQKPAKQIIEDKTEEIFTENEENGRKILKNLSKKNEIKEISEENNVGIVVEEKKSRLNIENITKKKDERIPAPAEYQQTAAVPKGKEAEYKVANVNEIFENKQPSSDIKFEQEKRVKEKMKKLEDVLREYGIDAKVTAYKIGPVITRMEMSVILGTRVKKIVALADELAMNLEAKSIRIEAPIPGKNAIGVEIPNDVAEPVCFSSILKGKKYGMGKSPVDIILGKDIIGEDIIVDLRKMPHLLIAGRTGAGKSVCINTLISSIIYKSSPEEVKFIMVDPKMVELMPYNGIPHLLVPVIIEPKQAAIALKWAVNEMESRYKLLAKACVRNLEGYNKLPNVEKLPYIVVIIDELADLMMVAPASVEESIARIAQKARAIGIHLVVATQRPSIDVITGTIKANLPSRISFAVASQIDSRTILDCAGSEKLLGRGDMLFLESGSSHLVRIQGAFISDEEVLKFTEYLKSKGMPNYKQEILIDSEDESKDELFEKVVELIKNEGKISTSLIQRKLKVGYSRAARIMDQLEEDGIIGINENGERELMTNV